MSVPRIGSRQAKVPRVCVRSGDVNSHLFVAAAGSRVGAGINHLSKARGRAAPDHPRAARRYAARRPRRTCNFPLNSSHNSR